jgi:lipoate-protein ligase A
VLPKNHSWTKLKGAESYRIIHEALVRAMQAIDIEVKLSQGEQKSDSIACFEHPVSYDVIDPNGKKLAGAGQKRSRQGLLHQGSVIGIPDNARFRQCLLNELSDSYEAFQPELTSLNIEKYKVESWTRKR